MVGGWTRVDGSLLAGPQPLEDPSRCGGGCTDRARDDATISIAVTTNRTGHSPDGIARRMGEPARGWAVERDRHARAASRLATDKAIEEGEEIVEVEGLREDRSAQSFQVRGPLTQ